MAENKTNINWYPGHMTKTKRMIVNCLPLVDVVVELLTQEFRYRPKIRTSLNCAKTSLK